MKDGRKLALVKAIVRLAWSAELWLRRICARRWRRPFWRLVGDCHGCGACCVEPSIRASGCVRYVPFVRRLFVAWQLRVNGFALVRADSHDLIFRCTHHDPSSKRCDSYTTRPTMCRDYPTVLLGQPWPELFEACGYRVLRRRPAGLAAGIDATSLSPEAKAELRRKLRLE